jgi:hypothetical protein
MVPRCYPAPTRLLTSSIEELSGRMVEGRPLSVEIRTSTGETLAGPTSYELPSTSPATPHTPRVQVTSHSVVSPSSIISPSTTYHANSALPTQVMSGAAEMQANYNVSYSSARYHLTPVTMNTTLQASPDYNRRTSTIQGRRPGHEESWYPVSQACLSGQVTALISAEPFGQQLPPGLPTSPGYVASMSPTGYTSAVPMAAFNTAQPMLIPLHEGVIASSQGIPPSPREPLQVCAAMPNTPGPEPAPNQSQRTIYIQNVHYQATWKDLKDHLRGKTAGHVDHCRIFNGEDGRSRGRGIAIFRTAGEAERAVRDVDGKKFQGKRLKITLNEPARKEDPQAPVEKLSTSSSAGRSSKGTGPLVVDGTQLVVRRKVKR